MEQSSAMDLCVARTESAHRNAPWREATGDMEQGAITGGTGKYRRGRGEITQPPETESEGLTTFDLRVKLTR